jgi:hypothetical protein
VVVEDGIGRREWPHHAVCPARRSSLRFWGQVLGTESAAALPREATMGTDPEASAGASFSRWLWSIIRPIA